MEHQFWASRWQAGQTGFHLDVENPSLVRFWPELGAAKGSAGDTVLVPLCGKSHDLTWLERRGHDVRGVEFVAEAAAAFFAERGQTPTRTRQSYGERLRAGGVEIHRADFFALSPPEFEPCAAIYDRAALVAIEPLRRAEYFEQLAQLSRAGAKLLLVNFVHDIPAGPPFSIPELELLAAARDHFALEKRSERDILEHEPRFRERGATHMVEQVWFGERRA